MLNEMVDKLKGQLGTVVLSGALAVKLCPIQSPLTRFPGGGLCPGTPTYPQCPHVNSRSRCTGISSRTYHATLLEPLDGFPVRVTCRARAKLYPLRAVTLFAAKL